VAVLRLVESRISRRHQKIMLAKDAVAVREPHFKSIVVVHTAVLVAAALSTDRESFPPQADGCVS